MNAPQADSTESLDSTDNLSRALDALRGHPQIAPQVVAAFEALAARVAVIEQLAGLSE